MPIMGTRKSRISSAPEPPSGETPKILSMKSMDISCLVSTYRRTAGVRVRSHTGWAYFVLVYHTTTRAPRDGVACVAPHFPRIQVGKCESNAGLGEEWPADLPTASSITRDCWTRWASTQACRECAPGACNEAESARLGVRA